MKINPLSDRRCRPVPVERLMDACCREIPSGEMNMENINMPYGIVHIKC
jgi:hypothetical protein